MSSAFVATSMSEVLNHPFAIHQRTPRPLVASIKLLVVLVGFLVTVIVAQTQTRQWLLSRWASEISDLPVGEQIERLLQIHALGDVGTEMLARQIVATDDRVAATAFDLLRDQISTWVTRDDDSLARAHGRMLAGLNVIIDEVPPTRRGWITQLVNQSIVECVEQRGGAMREAYRLASDLTAKLAGLAGENATTIADVESAEKLPPVLAPLPVPIQVLESPEVTSGFVNDPEIDQQPTLFARVGPGPLMVVAAPSRQAVHHVSAHPDPAENFAHETIQPLTRYPLQTFDTKSVIGLLSSKQAAIRDQAVDELVRRGLSNEEIRIANQLAAPQLEVRLGLIDSIARRTDVDPRPWLLWLTEDANREVRMRAVNSLAAMNDSAVIETLRKRLATEADPDVVAQLRRVIDRRIKFDIH